MEQAEEKTGMIEMQKLARFNIILTLSLSKGEVVVSV